MLYVNEYLLAGRRRYKWDRVRFGRIVFHVNNRAGKWLRKIYVFKVFKSPNFWVFRFLNFFCPTFIQLIFNFIF